MVQILFITLLCLVANIGSISPHVTDDVPTGEILFLSERDGNSEVYVMKADGSNVRNLTNNPAYDVHAAWSSDGEYIAFVSDRNSNPPIQVESLYIMDADGNNVKRLLTEDLTIFPEYYLATGSPFSWSPDGRKIAVSATVSCSDCVSEPRIYIIDLETNDIKQLSYRNGYSPIWSLDGLFIGFVSSFSTERLWSFGIVHADEEFEVYIQSLNGETFPDYETMSAVYDINIDEQMGQSSYDRTYNVELLDITDPNNWLPFDSRFIFEQEQNLAHIHVESQETGKLSPPTELINGDWNLFLSDEDGDWEIFIQNITTDEIIQLTQNNVLDGPASWRPQPATQASS